MVTNQKNNLGYENLRIFSERCCDALVLAYEPRSDFYIPSKLIVKDSFRSAFDEILTENAGILETRIEQLDSKIMGDREYGGFFDLYFQNDGKIQLLWDLPERYRFVDEQREIALKRFEEFWSDSELGYWHQIHQLMREFKN